jgi:hypothetical protein
VDGSQTSNGRVALRVSGSAGGVGPGPDTSGVVGDVVSKNVVYNGRGLLLSPSVKGQQRYGEKTNEINSLGQGIRPTLTHSASFSGLQAPTGTSTSHAVSDTVGEFVDDDIVAQRAIAVRLHMITISLKYVSKQRGKASNSQ